MEIDRRRGRRVSLEAPMSIRRADSLKLTPAEENTKNVGLSGVYFETHERAPYAVGTMMIASISIGETQQRMFPFTRLAGHGRVVRVVDLQPEGPSGPRRVGVALEFGNDVTALTAIPRG